MNKKPVEYTAKQMDEIEDFIHKQWGGKCGYILHEIQSEYLHTDVQIIEDEDDGTVTLATFGMGARKMNSPLPDYKRAELLMLGSAKLNAKADNEPNKDIFFACSELVRLTKYPFANDTWFGPGHTINASEEFEEAFGYQFFLFIEYKEKAKLSGLGNVGYLLAIPVYEDERNWMASHVNGSQLFIDAYFDSFDDDGNDMFMIDIPRRHIIPKGYDELLIEDDDTPAYAFDLD